LILLADGPRAVVTDVTLSRVRVAGVIAQARAVSCVVLEASSLIPSMSFLTFVLSLSFLLSFVLLLLLSLLLTVVWPGYSRSGSIGNRLNPGPTSAR